MDKNNPKISVIIPCYNAEKWVGECLYSVLNQSLTDIEVICVDDCSSDLTYQILRKETIKDPRIKVIQNRSNLGVAESRNIAINCSSGQYLAFIDPDDIFANRSVLATLFKKAKEHDALICGGSSVDYNPLKKIEITPKLQGYSFQKEGFVEFKDYQFNYGFWRFIYKSEMIKTEGILFPPYRRYQDPIFFVKAMLAAEKFYAIPMVVYKHSLSHRNFYQIFMQPEICQHTLLAMSELLEIANKNELGKLHSLVLTQLRSVSSAIFSALLGYQNGESINSPSKRNFPLLKAIRSFLR